MKICIGLLEIAGYCRNLKSGFDEIGVEAEFWNLVHHPFQYQNPADAHLLVRLTANVNTRRLNATQPALKWIYVTLTILFKLLLLVWALFRFDTFIFAYSGSFLWLYDLPLMKLLGKKIIFVFYGSDARPPYIDGAITPIKFEADTQRCIAMTRKQKARLRKIERYADYMISFPYFGQFHERPFIDFLSIGIPFNNQAQSSTATETRTSTRIVHAPSAPEAKGTDRIREAINHLKTKGYDIDYVEIIGKPNAEVMRELGRCDFVVDQLYSDTPMSGFPTEAALMGKPSVVGGYGLSEIASFIPAELMPPSLTCHPDDVEQAIEQLITQVDFRLDLGKRAHEFVKTRWTPRIVAERYTKLLAGDTSVCIIHQPNEIEYVHGAVISEARAKALVKRIIEAGGSDALQLNDKPNLQAAFIKFAEI